MKQKKENKIWVKGGHYIDQEELPKAKCKVVTLIPAKGNSIRVPKKNIKMIAGKPLIAWTIEASLNAKYVDRTFVCTEDEEIKEVSLKYGAEVIDRPKKYAVDSIEEMNSVVQIFREEVNKLLGVENWGQEPEYLVHLMATTPLIESKHIDEALELIVEKQAEMLTSVHYMGAGPQLHCVKINSQGQIERLFRYKDAWNVTWEDREDKREAYWVDSVINIGRYMRYNHFASLSPGTVAYVLDKEEAFDIDVPFDFDIAEMFLKRKIAQENNLKNT